MSLTAPAIALVIIATLFSFLNGAKDGANALATVITSRSLAPAPAVALVALAQLCGPLIFGVAVARTIGTNIADTEAITIVMVLAATASATLWNVLMWWMRIPTSSTHALIGGLVGAVLAGNRFNFSLLHGPGLLKIAAGLFATPVVALVAAYVLMTITRFLLRNATPRVNWFFKRGQIVTTIGLALSHGANDAPKAMGMISLGLLSAGLLPTFEVPLWVILLAAGAVALGTALGGYRMVRTIGTRFYRVRAIHAFNSQLTSGLLVLVASLIGAPASTSQVVSSAIVGTGAVERLSKVRWGVMGEIFIGWLLTIPATALAAGLTYFLLSRWLGH